MRRTTWICLECGKTVYFPSVDQERRVVCTFCRQPALEEIPNEQIRIQEVIA
ncbi:hypothetical protein [uncultured Methanolobus sp.]|uniref:hypothetical protein n=1 Tax=uncultured Methanolobus sp. TaxID=218300 RepID=UPI0029C67615|nr:hypothetical protein [uncultured Methanolobus sp.]